MRCRELSKFWEFFEKLFGNFMDILGSLLRIFWEFFRGFFGRIFSGGIFWEEFFVYIVKVFEYEWNLCFCQDFGVMKGSRIFNP